MAGVGSLYGFDEERLYCEDRETIKTLGCEASPCTPPPTDRIVSIARTPNDITTDLFPQGTGRPSTLPLHQVDWYIHRLSGGGRTVVLWSCLIVKKEQLLHRHPGHLRPG